MSEKMKHCADCKIDLPDEYSFCLQCGGVLTEVAPALRVDATCGSCGAEMKPGWSHCQQCGSGSGVEDDEQTVFARSSGVVGVASPPHRINFPVAADQHLNPNEAGRSRRSARLGLILGLTGVVAVLLLGMGVVGYYFWFSNAALEKELDAAITRGDLCKPEVGSAYDLYNKLKAKGADANTLARYRDRLLPLLTTQPLKMLADFAVPTNKEPALTDWQDALKPMTWAGELKPDGGTLPARAKYIEGRIAYLSNKKEDAVALWTRASDLDGQWSVPPNGIGVLYSERKQYQTARQFIFEAIRREPAWAVPYNNAGTTFVLERNDDDAEAYYQQAVERAPTWARPHAWLGDIAMRRGDYDRAVSEYEATLNLAVPGNTTLKLNEIRKRLELARKKSQEPGDENEESN